MSERHPTGRTVLILTAPHRPRFLDRYQLSNRRRLVADQFGCRDFKQVFAIIFGAFRARNPRKSSASLNPLSKRPSKKHGNLGFFA
jgi:hypothetical protein